jgi:Ca-activated chloride channel homolog
MRLLLPIIPSLLLLLLPAACAQPADDFFNSGAQCYITNNLAQAKESVAAGLKLYPDDIKLKKLEELLKKQSQQQQNQPKQQNQKNQPSQPNRKQQPQNQPNQQEQNQSSQENGKKQPEQQPEKSAGKQSGEKQGEQAGPAQEAKAQEMSPEQAKRLLDAQKGDEQFLQLKPKNPPESQNGPIKDW